MALKLTVTTEGFEETTDLLGFIQEEIPSGRIMQAAFDQIGEWVVKDAQDNSPEDEGTFKASIESDVAVRADGLEVAIFSEEDVALFLERGTEPHFPPFGDGTPLSAWAARHGIDPFLVARAISVHGTPAYGMFEKSLDKNEKRAVTRVIRAVDKIMGRN